MYPARVLGLEDFASVPCKGNQSKGSPGVSGWLDAGQRMNYIKDDDDDDDNGDDDGDDNDDEDEYGGNDDFVNTLVHM